MALTTPQSFPIPFAINGDKNNIPTPSNPAMPNLNDGYPIAFEQPLDTTGLPILRSGINGILNLISQHTAWLNSGQTYTFDATLAAAGNYGIGTILFYAPSSRFVISVKANNTDNFVTTPSFINGTSWQYLDQLIPSATTTQRGIIQLATNAQTQALNSNTVVVTPGNLSTLVASTTQLGLTTFGTGTTTQGYTDNTRALTILALRDGINANFTKTTPGYIRFPGGLILQWGGVTVNNTGYITVGYPISFPQASVATILCSTDVGAIPRFLTAVNHNATQLGSFNLNVKNISGTDTGGSLEYLAIGF